MPNLHKRWTQSNRIAELYVVRTRHFLRWYFSVREMRSWHFGAERGHDDFRLHCVLSDWNLLSSWLFLLPNCWRGKLRKGRQDGHGYLSG